MFTPQILHNDGIRFFLGHKDDPREIESNGYANSFFFPGGGGGGGQKRCIMGFAKVENWKNSYPLDNSGGFGST